MIEQIKEEQLNVILNTLCDGILVTDEEGMILFCNETAATNYGVSKARLMKSHISYLMENGLIDQSFWKLAADTNKAVTRCV